MKTNSLIDQPCGEDWNKMKIGLVSRLCDSCCKNVHDFTAMEREEIILHLMKNAGNKICGRVKKVNLDYSYQEMSVTIDSLLEKNKNTNLAFYILTVGSLMLSGCDDKNVKRIPDVAQASQNPGEHEIEMQPRTCAFDSTAVPDSTEFILGMMMLVPDEEGTGQPRTIVSQMPEFRGGLAALNNFVKANLRYPEWERTNGIEGNVFVSFVVQRNGNLTDPKIIRTVIGSRNFDIEVLRVISEMPPWNPGKDNGERVDVRFVLPIKFKL